MNKPTWQEIRQFRRELKRERARRRRRGLLLLALVGGGVIAARSLAPKPTPGSGTVTLEETEPTPLSKMMGDLMRKYLQYPEKRAIADKMRVSIAIEDLDHPEMALTMSFAGSDVTISDGADPGADIYIGTELNLLLSLAAAPSGMDQLKWLRSEDGRKVVNALKSGRLKIRGIEKRPIQMLMYQKFMAPPPE